MLSVILLIFGGLWLARLSAASQKEDQTEFNKIKDRRIVLNLTIVIIFLQSVLIVPMFNMISDEFMEVKLVTLVSIVIGFLPILAFVLQKIKDKYNLVIVSVLLQALLGIAVFIMLKLPIEINQIISLVFTIFVIQILFQEKRLTTS